MFVQGQFTLGNGILHNGNEGHMRERDGAEQRGEVLLTPPLSHVNLHSPAS